MFDWLTQMSTFVVFLAIAGLGFTFLVISLVFGELFEHFGDHHFDHGDGPSFFSPRVLSVFVTAFGSFGAVATHYGLRPLPASAAGVVGGLFFGFLIFQFAHFLYGQQATSETKSADLIGQAARVIVAIPAGGVGQVRCRIGEELVDRVARTRDGGAIAENEGVVVEELLGETVIVRRA